MPEPKLSYTDAGHAIQTAVAYDLANGGKSGSPKHLRTGINLTKTDMAGLARLLVGKGIITAAEYEQAITDEANREVDRYEMAFDGKVKFR